jgi:hypothetical protein
LGHFTKEGRIFLVLSRRLLKRNCAATGIDDFELVFAQLIDNGRVIAMWL